MVKDSSSRGPEERDDKLSSPQADSGKGKEEPSGPEAPDREEDATKPDVEAGGSESGEESEQGEGGEEEHSESEEAGQTDAEPSGGESKDDRDGKLADAQTKSVGEKPETPEEPDSPKRQHTLPADNPGSPNQPSRRESLARAREHVQPESGSQKTEITDTSGPPPSEPAVEPVSPPPENSGSKTERPQQQGAPPMESGQAEHGAADERQHDLAEGAAEEPAGQADDALADAGSPVAPTSKPEPLTAPDGPDLVPVDPDRRMTGERPPDDNGYVADFDEDIFESGISDTLKRLVAKLDRTDKSGVLESAVDQPDFQDPEVKDPTLVPERYGVPLDRADGTRTPLFDGEPAREQTEQGLLGDCGIIAALGAVAECQPEAIRSCIRETDDGDYEVRLHEAKYSTSNQRYEPTGRLITLTVTPELPIKDQNPSEPAFARPASDGAAWVPVLEKAIAGIDQTWSNERRDKATRLWKARGKPGDAPTGYVRLNKGSSHGDQAELLTQLTGCPAKTVAFPVGYDSRGRKADRRLHDEIADQLSDNKPVLVGTRKLRKGESDLPKNLVPGHVYEVTKIDDKGKLHLRNPWNHQHPDPMTIQDLKFATRPRFATLD
ncbi:hypothetical protein [Actinomadura luteofluorescens]|uniref:hypothetical protein n=1 Tax=Actinomadura luteofluorescens TaxID=46163 RepID=UPI0021644014|nr:hypothetical protein [Actinomadura glauciflava]